MATHTPWRHSSELAMVRDWFYPSVAPDPYFAPTLDMRQTAVQHVQMWSFKDPKLPHAIIATANLTEAMLHDTLDRRKAISDWALRSVYSMAFCRFVNGFVDRDITKAALRANAATKPELGGGRSTGNGDGTGASTISTSKGEGSMYAHAAAIGLPEQFVDLRHRATHEEMPSLQVLRQMAKKGLAWLWERWWKHHATDHPGRALRAREERRLIGERKRVAAGDAAVVHGGTEAGDPKGAYEAAAQYAGRRWTSAPPADVGQDNTAGNSLPCGKRNYDTYIADDNAQARENGHNGKIAKVKLKSGLGSAFGLFGL